MHKLFNSQSLPHFFNPFVQYNERLFYELLFEASSQALQTFGRDERWLGAEIGFYGLLHTWGGKMWRHLHIHYIVTAGGLTADGIWIKPRYSSRFLFPVKAMSKVFRAKFIEGLLARHQELLFPKGYQHLSNFTEFVGWLRHSCPLKWVVYSKRPFAGPETVVKYIGRYTHRVAISNGRIHAVCDDYVTFSYKDYQQEGTWAQCRLHIDEFIRRFLTHVLPFRFHKIRHYGFLSNGRAARNIKYILSLIAPENKEVSLTKPLKKEHLRCSSCQKGFMQVFRIISRFGRILYENKDIFPKDGVIDSS